MANSKTKTVVVTGAGGCSGEGARYWIYNAGTTDIASVQKPDGTPLSNPGIIGASSMLQFCGEPGLYDVAIALNGGRWPSTQKGEPGGLGEEREKKIGKRRGREEGGTSGSPHALKKKKTK